MSKQIEFHLEAERLLLAWGAPFGEMKFVGETDERFEYESETHYGHINKNGWGCGKGRKMSKEFWQRKEASFIESFQKRQKGST